MEESGSTSPGIDRCLACHSDLDVNSVMDISIAYLNKKRKFQSQLLEMNLQTHVCGDQILEYDSSDLSTKKVKSSLYNRGAESDPNSAEHSYSFNGDAFTCPPEDTKICTLYLKTPAMIEPFTTSAGCDGASSEISHYSLESRSLTKSTESSSICEEVDCHGLQPSHSYEEHILEFGSYDNCSCLECQKDGFEHCTDKVLDDLLCSNGVAPSNYVLSSGRWSVDQDTKQDTGKLTIDKEFEQYFSMLML